MKYLYSYRVELEMESGQLFEWEGFADDEAHAEGLAIESANRRTEEQVKQLVSIDEFDCFEEITEDEASQRYDEFLDCEGMVSVCGIEFYPSRVLSELDPIAYRCGFSDFTDSLLDDHIIVEGYY